MRIPPSLVLMGCVTAVPFSLAIRDEVRHAPRGDELDLTGAQARAREARARAEREEVNEKTELEARLRERDALLDSLFGRAVAQRGTLTESTPEIEVAHDHDVMTISVPIRYCYPLHEKLVAMWGTAADDIWINPATHDRASYIDDASCSLRFEHYMEPEPWVESLPFSWIGNPPSTDWESPGIGYGREVTRAYPESKRGVIVSVNVVSDTDLATQSAIRDALSNHLRKQPVQGDDPQVWTWQTQPPVRFDASGASRFSLQIGTTSWQ